MITNLECIIIKTAVNYKQVILQLIVTKKLIKILFKVKVIIKKAKN